MNTVSDFQSIFPKTPGRSVINTLSTGRFHFFANTRTKSSRKALELLWFCLLRETTRSYQYSQKRQKFAEPRIPKVGCPHDQH